MDSANRRTVGRLLSKYERSALELAAGHRLERRGVHAVAAEARGVRVIHEPRTIEAH